MWKIGGLMNYASSKPKRRIPVCGSNFGSKNNVWRDRLDMRLSIWRELAVGFGRKYKGSDCQLQELLCRPPKPRGLKPRR